MWQCVSGRSAPINSIFQSEIAMLSSIWHLKKIGRHLMKSCPPDQIMRSGIFARLLPPCLKRSMIIQCFHTPVSLFWRWGPNDSGRPPGNVEVRLPYPRHHEILFHDSIGFLLYHFLIFHYGWIVLHSDLGLHVWWSLRPLPSGINRKKDLVGFWYFQSHVQGYTAFGPIGQSQFPGPWHNTAMLAKNPTWAAIRR